MSDDPPTLEYAGPTAGQQVPRYAIFFYVAAAAFLLPLGGLTGLIVLVLAFGPDPGKPRSATFYACVFTPAALVLIGGGVLACQEAWRLIRLRRAARRDG